MSAAPKLSPSVTIDCRLKCCSTRFRPFMPSPFAVSASSKRQISLEANASESRGGTKNPVSPSTTSSGTPPTFVATTGLPDAIASSSAMGRPSDSDGSAKRSITASNARTSSLKPRKRTRCPRP